MSIAPALEVAPVIWTVRFKTGRVVVFLASVSRAFRAVASIVLVAAEDSVEAVIALVVVGDLAVAASAALAEAAVEDSGADAEN